jgi:hypothetical protein
MTAEQSDRVSQQLNSLAVQARAMADTLHAMGEKELALVGHDYARALEAKAEQRHDYAKLNFRVL